MHIHKKWKGVLAIADPEFENNNNVTLVTVDYDEQICIKCVFITSIRIYYIS